MVPTGLFGATVTGRAPPLGDGSSSVRTDSVPLSPESSPGRWFGAYRRDVRTHAGFPLPSSPGTDPLRIAARLRTSLLDVHVVPDRAAALAIDALAVGASWLVTTVLLLVLSALAGSPATEGDAATQVLLALVAVVAVLLLAWPLLDGGRTVGMRLRRLRVTTVRGEAPAPVAVLVRSLVLPLDLLGAGVLVLARRDRRRLGDLVAGTQVIRDVRGPAAR